MSLYHAFRQHDEKGWGILRRDSAGSVNAVIVAANLTGMNFVLSVAEEFDPCSAGNEHQHLGRLGYGSWLRRVAMCSRIRRPSPGRAPRPIAAG